MKKRKNTQEEESPIMIVSALKTTPAQKNIRKTSEIQKDLLIDYFERHPGAIDVVSSNNTDGDVKRRIWSEVSEILNKVEGGAKKNDLKWSKTWADMKLYTKNRARAAKNGQISMHSRKPSDLDKRVLKVTGHSDLLMAWEASLGDGDISNATVYEKLKIDVHKYKGTQLEDSENEIIVTEGTDYEYIDEEEMGNDEQSEQEKLENYYENQDAPQYEYAEPLPIPIKIDLAQNKRKRHLNSENTQVIDLNDLEEIQIATDEPQIKRIKPHEIETETQTESEDDERQSDPMVGAINNLANALQSVASALTSFAEVAKSFNRR